MLTKQPCLAIRTYVLYKCFTKTGFSSLNTRVKSSEQAGVLIKFSLLPSNLAGYQIAKSRSVASCAKRKRAVVEMSCSQGPNGVAKQGIAGKGFRPIGRLAQALDSPSELSPCRVLSSQANRQASDSWRDRARGACPGQRGCAAMRVRVWACACALTPPGAAPHEATPARLRYHHSLCARIYREKTVVVHAIPTVAVVVWGLSCPAPIYSPELVPELYVRIYHLKGRNTTNSRKNILNVS